MINFNLKLEKNCLFDNMYIRYTKARVALLDKVFEYEKVSVRKQSKNQY